ncbi:hypothetical protein GCM10009133_36310 [Cocleimonas flava]|uniref:Uncharacterized protein n=1 Tax=Cocleimonas flava TaxID=634765 RepID=A0A4R1F2W0_9GAMM|nr:hypothetical protein [Cocleimonas flava]TCJ88527.1 hypothetical protein EV695_0384 [Cocleimonas flava]
MHGIIKFPGNPWPEGHPLKDFRLGVLLHGSRGDIPAKATLDLRFRSEDYCPPDHFEKMLAVSEAQREETSNWESISSWLNYGAAYATSIASHEDMVIADEETGFDIECLNDFARVIDPIPETISDDDNNYEIPAFHSHILSWDDMADHHMHIKRNPKSGLYDIYWKGKCGRSDIGNYRYQHEFELEVSDVPFGGYSGHKLSWQKQAKVSLEERDLELRSLLKSLVNNPGKMQFKTGHFPGRDQLLPD